MKKKNSQSTLILILGLLILVSIYIFYYSFSEQSQKITSFETNIEPKFSEKRETTIKVPAVDKNNKGTIAELSVDLIPGTGKTLVEIGQLSFFTDTQESIRIAKQVAQKITGKDLSNYDLLYSVRTNASVIEGPSAGPAMAVATILSLEDKKINESVTITGNLFENGNIGPVSSTFEKAKAAKNAGMELLLVSVGGGFERKFIQKKECEYFIFTQICRTITKTENIDIEKEVGIRVEEVKNIEEALKFFVVE